MIGPITATLLTAAFGSVAWLLLRRNRALRRERHSQRPSPTSEHKPETIYVGLPKVAGPPDVSSTNRLRKTKELESIEAECEPGHDGLNTPEGAISAQLQSQPDAPVETDPESQISDEADCARLAAEEGPRNEDFTEINLLAVPSLPSIEKRLRDDALTSQTEAPSIGGQHLPIHPSPLTTAATSIDDQNLDNTYTEVGGALDAIETSINEGTRADANTEESLPAQRTDRETSGETEKPIRRYRPPSSRPQRQATSQSSAQTSSTVDSREVLLGILVHLIFDRFGSCEITLLPERTSGLDDEVVVKHRGQSLSLLAQEDWYQDLHFQDIGDLLRQSLELKGVLVDKRPVRWLLTGRDLYVLASHQRASAYVSTSRLALGRSHVVLCKQELLREVETILREAKCEQYAKITESEGVPAGWVALRGVSPTSAVPLDPGSDSFYAIKPAPDIEIDLEGGVWLRNSVWLAGYPPRIRLLGQTVDIVRVLIDGKEAERTAEGFFAVDGCDQAGSHSVYCEGFSCSYSIEEPPDSWDKWPAYSFGQSHICGPLVQMRPGTATHPLTVPMSNPLLLGSKPGEIFRCSPRRVSQWKGFVPFDVVWALPTHPLICDKQTARILHFASVPISNSHPNQSNTRAVLEWCDAILNASRKGLRIDDLSPEAMDRWRGYKKAARTIWRAAR